MSTATISRPKRRPLAADFMSADFPANRRNATAAINAAAKSVAEPEFEFWFKNKERSGDIAQQS